MKRLFKFLVSSAALGGHAFLMPAAQAEMQSLDDSAMAAVSGQSGITLDAALKAEADRLSYFDDGTGVHLDGFRISSSTSPSEGARHRVAMDIRSDSSVNLDFLVEDRRVEFSDLRIGTSNQSGGGFFLDQTLHGNLNIVSGGASGAGYTFDLNYDMTDGRLGYRTNGNEVFLDGIAMSVSAPGITLDEVASGLDLAVPSLQGNFQVDAIRYSDNPANHGSSIDAETGSGLPSYGALSGDFDLSLNATIQAAGRFGSQGLRIDGGVTVNSANFLYLDDGKAIALRNISGSTSVTGLHFDVAPDWAGRDGFALTVDEWTGDFHIGSIELGGNGGSIGSLAFDYRFAGRTFHGTSYSNQLFIMGGGHPDAGTQGLRLAAQWSLDDASFAWTEDGNTVVFSGMQSWGRGDLTVNVTRNGTINGTRFYDGIRFGFDGIEGGYRLNGLRVGSEDADLQGGTELLLALGVYPSYDFTIDGHITIGPGGASGEGLTINSDVSVSDGSAAILADAYDEGGGEKPQKGLWATELNYDSHIRDMTIDVTDDGLAIIKGEAWGTMDIGNLRVGEKGSQASFGRMVFQHYEKGSSMTIKPGGAGNVCVGGSGATESECAGSGGYWEARGEQGVTIALKQILARAVSETKRNAFIWETNRQSDANGLQNGTGTRLVLNDIHTTDGGVDLDGDGREDNTFGIQTDLNVDIYQTRVVKKQDGADSNGVIGQRGDEKIMDATTDAGYRYESEPTATDRENRPLGFAVQAHSRFKELSVDQVDLVHPTGGSATALHGIKMQNFDIKANLTATPIQ